MRESDVPTQIGSLTFGTASSTASTRCNKNYNFLTTSKVCIETSISISQLYIASRTLEVL